MNRSRTTSGSNQFSRSQSQQQYLTGELTIQIDNLPHIAAAYGEAAAIIAEDVVHQLVLDIIGALGTVTRLQSGQFHVAGPRIAKQIIYGLLPTVMGHPLKIREDAFHLVISVTGPDFATRPTIASERSPWLEGRQQSRYPAAARTQWIAAYRADMAAAAALFKTLNDDHVDFETRPVRYAGSCDIILYHELCAGIDGHDIGPASPAAEPLRRLGLLRVLEEHVVQRTIDALCAAPDLRLGVNISMESAVLDLWWFNVCERLGSAPSVAERLVFELNGIDRLPATADAIDFMTDIKRYGCQIALDDLGPDHVPVWSAGAFSPDIAKIEARQIQGAGLSDCGHDALALLIKEAAHVSGLVIVQGVRTQSDSALASDLGCCWQQGPHFEASGTEAPGYVRRIDANALSRLLGPPIQGGGGSAKKLYRRGWTVMVTAAMWTAAMVALFICGLHDLRS
jgi:EAL domain-containing protein (putative c-di-GMP-specific phosphodiesterase class I)